MQRPIRPTATRILITADAGGSNGARLRLWKLELQTLADTSGLWIAVCHFPPGTSKWNKVEHRLFSFISSNWRGEPLRDYETIVYVLDPKGEIRVFLPGNYDPKDLATDLRLLALAR